MHRLVLMYYAKACWTYGAASASIEAGGCLSDVGLALRAKIAVATGGSLGIGRAIALEPVQEGVAVAILAHHPARLEAAGVTGRILAVDGGPRHGPGSPWQRPDD